MMVTGKQPTPVTDRVHNDDLKLGNYGVVDNSSLLRLMDAALEIDYKKRTQDISAFRDGLERIFPNKNNNAAKRGSKPDVRHGSNLRYMLNITLYESLLGVDVAIPVPQDIICEECRGKGRVNNDKPCGTCKGKGIVTIKKKISVNVPAGIDSGERLTIEGEGDQLIGGESGDLFVDIKIDPDPIYKRKGSNLIRDLCITSRIANNGGRVKTSTPWGDIHVVIPNKSADGQLLRLKGKGVKFGANSSGDLMLRLKIAKNNSFIDKMKSLFARIGI